jgi:hypothetical protein
MDSYMAVTYAGTFANLILLGALLYPALSNLIKTRSSVTASVAAFIFLLLLQNVVAIYFHIAITYTVLVELEMMVLTLLETASFASVLWITYK